MDGRRRHISTPRTSCLYWLTSNFKRWARPINPSYLRNLGVIGPEEHEFLNIEVPPIHSYGKSGQQFLTTCTWWCLERHWRHNKFWPYSLNAKIAHANLIHLFNVKFQKLHPGRTFPFPVWTTFTLGFLKRSTTLKVYQIGEKSIQGNQSYEDMKFCQTANAKNPYLKYFGSRTSIAYNLPIYTLAWSKLGIIWDHYFTPNFLPLNFSLTFQIWWISSPSRGLQIWPFRFTPDLQLGSYMPPKVGKIHSETH